MHWLRVAGCVSLTIVAAGLTWIYFMPENRPRRPHRYKDIAREAYLIVMVPNDVAFS